MSGRNPNSLETILQYENRDLSQWSVIWSTSHIPGMGGATGGGAHRRREVGRRRLRMGSLALGTFLTMHCRVAASALTGGVFLFMLFLILAVVTLANPLRHFEVYLGQWSISGPGRAFRIIPMLDGIGIAICINAIVRAINCCSIAAIASLYVFHSVADAKLPFTYCRDFDLKSYEPIMKDYKTVMLHESRFSMETGIFLEEEEFNDDWSPTTVGLSPNAWRNATRRKINSECDELRRSLRDKKPRQIAVCHETYKGRYPVLYSSPAYNFFYVEVVQLRDGFALGQFNIPLVLAIVVVWSTIWGLIFSERFRYGRLVWNNIRTWFVIIPLIWALVLCLAAVTSIIHMNKSLKRVFRIGAKEVLTAIADALEVALYIHSVSVGTETILGKGLNHYASGHIDPHLDKENVWHSALLLIVSTLNFCGATLCALVDSVHVNGRGNYNMPESTLWVMPMYSKCASLGDYSHLMSTLIFGGLMLSYMTVAFVLLKTALHIIFEYQVKLIFIEQVVVGALILTCMGLSFLTATNGGIALLESVDSLMSGVAVPCVCLMELVGLLYVYRSHDFVSDMNLSMEESACTSRMSTQWQMIPFITLATILLKALMLGQTELPAQSVYMAIAPVAGVALAVPLRGIHNAIVFMRPAPRRGT